MKYLARVKIHDPTPGGVLVELNGEFDVSCLDAFRRALLAARTLGGTVFVELSGVCFMDAICTRELLCAATNEPSTFKLCQPSWEVKLSATACGIQDELRACPADDPRYEALIGAACRCRESDGTQSRTQRDLYTMRPQDNTEP